MTNNKTVLKLNENTLVTFMLRFSNSDLIRVLIMPQVGSLNDFIALKFSRALRTYLPNVEKIN